jgi:hypothetical protein
MAGVRDGGAVKIQIVPVTACACRQGTAHMKVMQNRIVQMNETAKARQRARLEGMKGHVVPELKYRQRFTCGKRFGIRRHDVYRAAVERFGQGGRGKDFHFDLVREQPSGKPVSVIGDAASLRRPGCEQVDFQR